jgi:hypothetical protein
LVFLRLRLNLLLLLLSGFIHRSYRADSIVKMRHISGDRKTRESVSPTDISGDRSDDLHSLSFSGVKNRTAADSSDGYAVNQIAVTLLLSCTDHTREETKSGGRESGEPKPTHLCPDSKGDTVW